MDIQPLKQEIEGLISQVTDAQKQTDLQTKLDDLVTQHGAAGTDAARQQIEAHLSSLRDEAKAAVPVPEAPPAPPGQFLSKGGFILVVLLTVLSFGFLVYFVERMVRRDFSSVESVQFLIVLTLILSMLGFGGLLIIRAMFAPYGGEELQNRFRMGREIFLVFSGVFGTIIGFYFGSEEDQGDNQVPSVVVTYEAGRVNASVVGGVPPFTGIFTLAGQTGGEVIRSDKRILSWPSKDCPDKATILVVVGGGGQAEGTVDCGEDEAADNATADAPAEGEEAPDTPSDDGSNTNVNKV